MFLHNFYTSWETAKCFFSWAWPNNCGVSVDYSPSLLWKGCLGPGIVMLWWQTSSDVSWMASHWEWLAGSWQRLAKHSSWTTTLPRVESLWISGTGENNSCCRQGFTESMRQRELQSQSQSLPFANHKASVTSISFFKTHHKTFPLRSLPDHTPSSPVQSGGPPLCLHSTFPGVFFFSSSHYNSYINISLSH